MPEQTLAVILGGGRGTRLAPLTTRRSKPAVPLAGKYRLIDIPISNSINSGIFRCYVLTQFNSASLNRHLSRTYRFDGFKRGWVEVLAAEQTESSLDWFQGTADAVRKHLHRFRLPWAKRVLIQSGDQLYRMDFRELLRHHDEQAAEITVAVIPVTRQQATSFGLLRLDETGRIVEFAEKPKDPDILDHFKTPQDVLGRMGFHDPHRRYLASMGIYLFTPDTLDEALRSSERIDFGRDVLPNMLRDCRVSAFVFDGYWEDIGTIRAFYEANLALCKPDPEFAFYSPEAPVFTRPRFLPASKLYDCRITESIVSDGCLVAQAEIEHCVVGLRTVIQQGTVLRNTVIMGADFYESLEDVATNRQLNRPDLGVGEGSRIENAILDKNARIGKNVTLINRGGTQFGEGPGCVIRDGIICVPKDTIVPDGTSV